MKNFSKILTTWVVAGSLVFGNLPMVFANPQQAEIEAKICELINEKEKNPTNWYEYNSILYDFSINTNGDYFFYSEDQKSNKNFYKNTQIITEEEFRGSNLLTESDYSAEPPRKLKNTKNGDDSDEYYNPLLKDKNNNLYSSIQKTQFNGLDSIKSHEIYKNNQLLISEVFSKHDYYLDRWDFAIDGQGNYYYMKAVDGKEVDENWDGTIYQDIEIYKNNEKIYSHPNFVTTAVDRSEGYFQEKLQLLVNSQGDVYLTQIPSQGTSKAIRDVLKNGQPLCEKATTPTPHPLEEKIAKLPAVNDVTLADEAKISEIKKEFDRLSEEDKKKIPAEKVKKLADLEAKIAELKKKKEDGEKNNSGNSENNSNNSSTSNSSSGPGGGYVVTTTATTTATATKPEISKPENTKTETPKTENSTKLFPKFVAKKAQAVTDLRDAKLADLNKRFGIVNEKTRNEALSRGEFLRIVLDSANANLSGVNTEKLTFADVGKNTEIAKYIAFARENNIISGYSDNTFRANATISRAEATKILIESLNVKIAEKNTTFADVTAENTLGKYIQTAYDNYILSGTSKTTFEPNRSISRGELIKIIYNILN